MKSCKASIFALIISLICVGAVSAGTLARIYISPGSVAINQKTIQQFKVYGLDAEGNDVPVSDPVTWSVDPHAGTITQDGVLTAAATTGFYAEAVKASIQEGLSAMAAVEIAKLQPSGDYYFRRAWSNGAPGELAGSRDVTVDSLGNLYVLDFANRRVQKFDPQGNYILQWGYTGSGDGQLNWPWAITVDSQDNVYVLDEGDQGVQVFTSTGTFIRRWKWFNPTTPPIGIAVDPSGYVYVADSDNMITKYSSTGTEITKWSIASADDAQTPSISDIATGKDGTLYVADYSNSRVLLFDSSCKTIGRWNSSNGYNFSQISNLAVRSDGSVYVCCAGIFQRLTASGTRLAQYWLSSNGNFAVASDGKLYVAGYPSLTIYDQNGKENGKIGLFGIGHCEYPTRIAVDSNSNIYMIDIANPSYIHKYSSNGICLKKWCLPDNQYWYPEGICIDANDNIYVADYRGWCIRRFDREGNLTSTTKLENPENIHLEPLCLTLGPDGSFYIIIADLYEIYKYDHDGHFITKWGGLGSDDGQFGAYSLIKLAVDAQGYVYVADTNNDRIQKFDSNGKFIRKWGSPSFDDGCFNCPTTIVIDSKGFIYVADTICIASSTAPHTRIQIFDSNGQLISKWLDQRNTAYGLFLWFDDLAIDKSGNLFALDYMDRCIQVISTYLTSVGTAKSFADGEVVSLTNQITTAGTTNFGNCFYIESPDRTSGIKVTGVTAYGARKASVVGVLVTVNGEREIQAFTCTATSSGNVKPLAMNNKSVGGGKTSYQDGVWKHQTVLGDDGKPQTVWAKVKGLNNIGLFIRTFGKVISSDSTTHTFIVSDGSSQDGIKCWAPANLTLPAVGNIIAVNGVSTCERNEQGELTPLLRLRGAIDITTIKKATL